MSIPIPISKHQEAHDEKIFNFPVVMNIGIHHFLHKYKGLNEDVLIENRNFRRFINRSVYAAGVLGVIAIIPQILKIWVQRDFGVSITTWIGFLIAAAFWLFYGLIHKEKPIILTNLAVIIADLMVIYGLLFLR